MRSILQTTWQLATITQDVSDLLEDVKNMSAISLEDFDTSQVYDDFWISVRGPLADQAVVLDRMKELLADHQRLSTTRYNR